MQLSLNLHIENIDAILCRTSGNLCLSFSALSCGLSDNRSIETPQVTAFIRRKKTSYNQIAIILGASGGALFALLFSFSLLVFFYLRKRNGEVAYTASMRNLSFAFPVYHCTMLTMVLIFKLWTGTDMRNWNAAKVFSYKEVKAATNNFKEVIGRGSFGSVYLGKLPDGKLVAVKVRFDRSQLGADSFINEVCYPNIGKYNLFY